MKVTGGGPRGIPDSTSDAPETVKGTDGTDFANKLGETSSAQGAAGAQGAASEPPVAAAQPTTPSFVGDISAKLKEGKLSPEQAVDQVMSRILDRQLGEGAPSKMRAAVESAMRDALDSDPVLSAKLGVLNAD
jgi:hypothetical protein